MKDYIHQLLGELAVINNKYESIEKATSCNYNIFQVLRVESKEVVTHSRIIADLLSPKGMHGMGPQFLSVFYDVLNSYEELKIPKPNDLERVVCTSEKNYGPIVNDVQGNPKGGNIDILLEGLEAPMVIENKIYASDQKDQLLRYSNQLNGNCHLYYLTLFGGKPSEKSTGKVELDVKLISYNIHILQWLGKCYQLAIERPILRETLKQYINTIKILTGQSMNDEKNQEIFNLIEKNKESLADLHTHMNSFVNNHLKNLILEIVEEIIKNESLMKSLEEKPFVFPWQDYLACHFKFGNQEETGIIFEIRTQNLSLHTTAWRWDGKYTYGADTKLKEALGNMYEASLDSMKSVQELTQEVTFGLEEVRKYYESLLKPNE